jgi:diguanylate cyclase (GGDEF)-like protein
MSFIDKALNQAGPNPVGLLHIDLDNFKNMNDTHGHSAGDAVLVHAAGVVRDTIKRSDLVARVGGDEFVVVCLGMTTLNELAHLANEMIELISEPFEWNNRTLQGGTSIGAVMSQSGSTDADELLVNADLALYEAKRDGRNQVALYDNAMHDHHGYLMRRSANLIDIVDTDELSYYFQSTMDLLSGDVLGFATLVRWEHKTEGVIPPNHFLPLAKDLGLLGTLDLSSMAAALKEKQRLSLAGFPDINIAFNAFPELLAHPEVINRLIWGGEAGGINRGDITI